MAVEVCSLLFYFHCHIQQNLILWVTAVRSFRKNLFLRVILGFGIWRREQGIIQLEINLVVNGYGEQTSSKLSQTSVSKRGWCAKPLISKWFFIFMQMKLIFKRKVFLLSSFWKWEVFGSRKWPILQSYRFNPDTVYLLSLLDSGFSNIKLYNNWSSNFLHSAQSYMYTFCL